MTRLSRLPAAACVALAVLAAGARPASDAPGAAVSAETPARVALSPVQAPADPPGLAGRTAPLDSLVVARLVALGFEVVPPESVAALRRATVRALGGLFDPVTGREVPGRADSLEARMSTTVFGPWGASAWVRPSLVVRPVSFTGSEVRWNGVSEPSGGRGGLTGLVIGTTEGTLPALSLIVGWTPAPGGRHAFGAGGIRLVRHAAGAHVPAMPADSLLGHAFLNARAVALAVDSALARAGRLGD